MKDIQTIVDENDEIIGYKLRREITIDDIYRVSALWIQNSRGDVLIAQRGYMKSNNPWKWSAAVAGTINEWENYEENIYKEAEEEIWLIWELFKKWEKNRVIWKHNYFCQWYSLILDRDIHDFVLEDEVETLRWFTPQELKNLLKHSPEIFTKNFWEKLKDRFL